MALLTQKINPRFRKSYSKSIFRSFSGHPAGFGGEETGSVAHVSVLPGQVLSGLLLGAERPRSALVTTFCASPHPVQMEGAEGPSLSALPSVVQLPFDCCLLFRPATMDEKGACVHATELELKSIFTGKQLWVFGVWSLVRQGRRVRWGARPL